MKKKSGKKLNSKPDFFEAIPLKKKIIIIIVILFFFGLKISIEDSNYYSRNFTPPNGPCNISLNESRLTQQELKIWSQIKKWCPYIENSAKEKNIDPLLIVSVIWIESRGNPGSYSRSGAVGLMQVMPRNGIASRFMCKYGPCFRDRPTIDELFEPKFNVDYGSKILKENLIRTGSDREALKSYGPINVGYTYADSVLSIYRKISN